MSKLMEAFKLVVPLIPDLMLVDCIVELADSNTKEVVAVCNGKTLNFGIKPGDLLNPDGVAEVALRTGERQIQERDSTAFGKPYIAVANPIVEDGRLVGVITVGYSTAEREQLRNMSEKLFAFVEEFSASMQQVSTASEDLTASSTAVIEQTEKIAERVKETGMIIGSVKDISKQTQILGINASIEAARVGVAGRGFAVVAGEIQKLATFTQESAKSIESTLQAVQEVFEQVKRDIGVAYTRTKDQNQAMQEMMQAVNKLSDLAGQLIQLSKSVQL